MVKCDKKIDVNKLSEVLEILSQPMRLQIVCLLSKVERLSVCEMIETFKIRQNLISHHLSMLKRIWIVNTQREWVKIFYSLEKRIYQNFKEDLKNIFNI
jgi:DNA-binding transcriptional ArsR family regulator